MILSDPLSTSFNSPNFFLKLYQPEDLLSGSESWELPLRTKSLEFSVAASLIFVKVLHKCPHKPFVVEGHS